jgi:hypothetical protein
MKVLSTCCIVWLLRSGRQMMSTWYSRAKGVTSTFVSKYCPSSTKTTGSSFVGFVCLMKWRNQWVKISLCIHPECWNMWIYPGGVPFISSCFIFFIVNTSNEGMECPFGLIHVTTVTRDLQYVDWREYIWRLSFSLNIFVFVLYNSAAGFVATVKSCIIRLNGFHIAGSQI